VRTVWSNPDDVVAKLMAISPADVLAGRGGELAKPIAAGAPSSPFAADYKAGASGLMVGSAVVGVLAAVAIPAFMDYMKKSKKSEAELFLNRIGKQAKREYLTNAQFPAVDAPLTPARGCCETQATCKPNAAQWRTPAWQALEFSIDDNSHYQYSYHSDGKTFTAQAVGDLDCDGTPVTYTLEGKLDAAGNPTVTLIKPPPGVY